MYCLNNNKLAELEDSNKKPGRSIKVRVVPKCVDTNSEKSVEFCWVQNDNITYMLKHFLMTYYRYVTRHKLHMVIHYVGLSIAIAVIILLFLFVNNEFTYDRYHANANRIFRLTTTITTPAGENPLAMSNTTFAYRLKKEIPGIENLTCIDIGGLYRIKYKDCVLKNENVRLSTPGIFDLFSYTAIKGHPGTLLTESNTAVLTESLAKKLFGHEDPIGKTVEFNDEGHTVTGIIKDLPENTDLTFSALLPSDADETGDLLDWEEYYTYFLVEKRSIPMLQLKINQLTDQIYKPLLKGEYEGISLKHTVQPLIEIHFNTTYLGDTPKGNKMHVYAFSCLGILILLIACINYINLTIAHALSRGKEMTIRKVNGLGKTAMFSQLIGESVITTLLSLLLSLLLVMQLIPLLNELTDKHFGIHSLMNFPVLFAIALIVFFVGLIAGMFPALYQFHFVKFRGILQINKRKGINNASKLLVTFQFILSISMIFAILVIHRQLNFMKHYDLGFNKNQILAVLLNPGRDSVRNIDVFRHELSNIMKIDKIASGGSGTQLGSTGGWMKSINSTKNADNEDIQFVSNIPEIDEHYLDVFEIKLLEGRNFSKSYSTDYDEGVIVNKTYVKTMGWKDPLGKPVYENSKLNVIGVVDDFHFASLHNKIEPLMFRFRKEYPDYMFLKIAPNQVGQVKTIWSKVFGDVPFEYCFVDENFEKQYTKDDKQRSLFKYLSFLAIFISCLGLYGLSSFSIARRTKEIGIRKVNGACIPEIITLLSKGFIRWVIIAFVIACPIAWYAMHKWLQSFAYKTTLSWWIFIAAGAVAMTIALLTVSWQSWRAASRNPVEALRYE